MKNKNTEALRVDRWLWFTRFYNTRMKASSAVQAGHVRINGERAKPGSRVGPGDTLELVKQRLVYKLHVLTIPVRRGPAAEARGCYEEDEAVQHERLETTARIREDRKNLPRTRGKPDKRTRRLLRDINRRDPDSMS